MTSQEDSNFIPVTHPTSHTQKQLEQRVKWSNYLLLIGIATTFGIAVPVGYNIGVINNPAHHMKSWINATLTDRNDVVLSDKSLEMIWSVVVAIFLVGGAAGSLGGAWVADRFGRKKSLLICCFFFVVAAICFLTCRAAKSIELLIIGRLIVGLASGLTTTVVPMYLIEAAPLSLSGTMGVLCSMGVTGGVVVGQIFSLRQVFGTAETWHIALGFYVVLVLVAFSTFIWWPESPKYLYVIAGKKEKAKLELKKLRENDMEYIQYEINEMEQEMHNKQEIRTIWSVLKDRQLLLPVVLVCALQGGQQLSGINAVFFYSVQIFKSAGVEASKAEWANLGAGCINLFIAFFSPFLMKTINRRPLSMLSCFGSSVFLFLLTFVVYFIDTAVWLSYACIASVFCYIIFYQIGLGPIPYFIGSELFEVPPRPAAMALGSLSSWTCNFIVALLFPTLQLAWGAWVFLPFAISCLLLTVLLKFYLPETRGKNPSEIAPLVSKGFASKPRVHLR